MVEFEIVTPESIRVLREIINSNREYNILSEGHEELTDTEILQMYESSKKIGAVMSFIMHDGCPVGIIDYLLENSSDKMPWLGLLMIHAGKQGQGFAIATLTRYEWLMRSEGFKKVRLGVIKGNERAFDFWIKRGFTFYRESQGEKTVICMEKEL